MQEVTRSRQTGTQQWILTQNDVTFCVRSLYWQDSAQYKAYQALRYQIFYEQLHWAVSITADGREVDRYDQCADLPLWTHTISLEHEAEEHLLAGVRTCALRNWDDAMVVHELLAAGLFSTAELSTLQASYLPEQLLEVTRLCVRRHRAQEGQQGWNHIHLHLAQQLAYAGVYQVAEHTGRSLVLAVVSAGYLRLLAQMGFVVHMCSARTLHEPRGYALTIIDLAASIHAMCTQGKGEQVAHLLCFCQNQHGMQHTEQTEHLVSFHSVQGEAL